MIIHFRSVVLFSVLKAVETIGIRCIKGTIEYEEALEKELRALKAQGVMRGVLARGNKVWVVHVD